MDVAFGFVITGFCYWGCLAVCGPYLMLEYVLARPFYLLSGTGNGYDEWSLDFCFLRVFWKLGLCGITFVFLGRLMRPGRR